MAIQKTKRLVLQVGESTHQHILESVGEIEADVREGDTISFMLKEMGILTHEEHGKMVLPPGHYVKYPQVEFDPLGRDIRQVFD
jgi:hypothetical protein